MIYKIENKYLTCEINSFGAELHSLKSKENGKEYIWYGNKEIWYGQAPILFPVIGRLNNDRYYLNGKEYSLPKHGFARKLDFEMIDCSDNRAVFSLSDSEDTLLQYPFKFELRAEFILTDDTLINRLNVINKDDKTMYFSIGAHPAFNCEVGDTIEFEENETICTERIDNTNLLIDKKFPLLENEKSIKITKEIFEPDALILSEIKSKKLRLIGKNEIEFTFGDAPVLGIWAKPGAPYVCIEPWYGINDSHEIKSDISEKREILSLIPGNEFGFEWRVKIIR